MKKKFTNTPLVDEHLTAIEEMREAETDEFFYTRLKARMERGIEPGFPLRPAWLVAILAIFLFVNTLVVSQEIKTSKKTNTESAGFQNFASSYNLTVSTPY